MMKQHVADLDMAESYIQSLKLLASARPDVIHIPEYPRNTER